ncbi:hypothetical protein Dimus_026548, partial [Dionaea muscipula]
FFFFFFLLWNLWPSAVLFFIAFSSKLYSITLRSDLYVNLPALKKIDGMLLSVLDGFKETEFWFVDRGVISVAAEDDDHRVYSGRPSSPCPRMEKNVLVT